MFLLNQSQNLWDCLSGFQEQRNYMIWYKIGEEYNGFPPIGVL